MLYNSPRKRLTFWAQCLMYKFIFWRGIFLVLYATIINLQVVGTEQNIVSSSLNSRPHTSSRNIFLMHISHNALLSANFYSLNSNSPLLLLLETIFGVSLVFFFLQSRYDCQSEAWLVKSYIYYYRMGYNDELTAKYNSSKTKPWNYKNFELLMKHSYNKLSYFMNTCHKNYELSLLCSVAVIWITSNNMLDIM